MAHELVVIPKMKYETIMTPPQKSATSEEKPNENDTKTSEDLEMLR